jgi:hypothetical protein
MNVRKRLLLFVHGYDFHVAKMMERCLDQAPMIRPRHCRLLTPMVNWISPTYRFWLRDEKARLQKPSNTFVGMAACSLMKS